MLRLRSSYLPDLFSGSSFGKHLLAQNDHNQTTWKIGRSPECDLTLNDAKVSGTHAIVQFIDGNFYFMDVGSSNGSIVNGDLLPPNTLHKIAVGDEIAVGETLLHVDEVMLLPSATHTPSVNVSWWIRQDIDAHCVDIIDETPDVKTFSFVADPALLFLYRPGQFARLEFQIEGERIVRAYTMSSSPSRPDLLQFTVKRAVRSETDVSVSNWLHDRFQVGDSIRILGGAKGSFTPAPQFPPKLLLVSAGSGITPMMSISRYLSDLRSTIDVVFFHSARTLDDCIFRNELELIANQNVNFKLKIALTQPQPKSAWLGFTGHLDTAMLQMIAPDVAERHVFVCGPDGFMNHVRQLFGTIDFPIAQYHEESFGEVEGIPVEPIPETIDDMPVLDPTPLPTVELNPDTAASPEASPDTSTSEPVPQPSTAPSASSPSSTTAPTVRFKRSNKSMAVDVKTSILDAAEKLGADINLNGCGAGRCGACKVKVCGTIEYPNKQPNPAALSAQEHQNGYVLSCIAYPIGSVEVDA